MLKYRYVWEYLQVVTLYKLTKKNLLFVGVGQVFDFFQDEDNGDYDGWSQEVEDEIAGNVRDQKGLVIVRSPLLAGLKGMDGSLTLTFDAETVGLFSEINMRVYVNALRRREPVWVLGIDGNWQPNMGWDPQALIAALRLLQAKLTAVREFYLLLPERMPLVTLD